MAAMLGAGRAGAFHEKKRGTTIRLSESNSVAERVSGIDDGVVFTAQPIALDTLYQVELLEDDCFWASGLAVGVTTRRPEDHDPVPRDCGYCRKNYRARAEHWILDGVHGTVCHHNQQRDMGKDFNLYQLQASLTAGFVVTKDGELHFQVNGKKGVGWTGLPTDKPLWGIFDVYGRAKKIKLLVFAPVQKAVQPKLRAPQRAESESPRSKQPPSQGTSQAHTEFIEDLMQENE